MTTLTNDIKVIVEDDRAWTAGLAPRSHPEIRAQVSDRSLLVECERFLRFTANYIVNEGTRIISGQTMAYGYWLTKFVAGGGGFLDTWEYNAQGTDFVLGATHTLTFWRDQHEECAQNGASFLPPRPDRLVVVSAGVMDGDPVEGARYPSPELMSGWWIVTKRYDGNTKSLRREHLYHLTAVRSDLARYIALPYGFCFSTIGEPRVWFEEETANLPAD